MKWPPTSVLCTKIPVKLDLRAPGTDVSLSPEAGLVTADLSGVSLRSALRIILGELDLTYVIRDEILMITTPEEAELQEVTKLYPVGRPGRLQGTRPESPGATSTRSSS